ncbi:MAG: VCBS repeat-containing protein [Lachnospiraceae bacterium]|nr:VCBS repeat-containing protein [Lachnospiraceae bacterium]
METRYHRLALFLADADGNILYKYNQFETNYLYKGTLYQPTQRIASVSFQDVNDDELTDILLITQCVNDEGAYAGKEYKVGDVLFQEQGGFYRDWRISDKINRFRMNMNPGCMISFVRDGHSAEFLYTASTLEELLTHDFSIIEEQCYTRNFEKLGRLQVVPGVFRMSEYDIFIIYLVDMQGDIVWSFQPMGDYDNLYSLKGITGKDVDGDGMKDLVVLARYSYDGADGVFHVESDCQVYYQRTGGFEIDTEFKEYYAQTQQADMEESTMEALVTQIREYWGWKVEETLE